MFLLRNPLMLLVATLATACWVEADPDPPRPTTIEPAPPAASGSSAPVAPTALLVKVDTGRTLNAAPGEGVGIFVEYKAGGKWHVWWTCDTNQSGMPCAFDLSIKSESGAIASIQSEGVLSGDSVVSSNESSVDARSNTGNNIVGVRFEAPAGGTISIDARVGGVRDPAYFFFVQDGKPNGGFSGALTNPIRFQGTSP